MSEYRMPDGQDVYLENRERYERVFDLLALNRPLEWGDRCWLGNMAMAGIDARYGPQCHCGAPVDERDAECSDCFRDRKLDEAGDEEYDRRVDQMLADMAAEHQEPKGA